MSLRNAVSTALVAAVLATTGVCCSAPAVATPGLVADTNVQGRLGFCDVNHQQVRAGSTAAAPFAWTTVSSVPAPAGYERGKTSIVAFQPRRDVDPMDWSGKQLNAASTFSNPKHPMASGTRIDSSFGDFTGTYTPQVDGLIQVRMYFTGVNKPMYTGSYPAALIKVEGNRWTQVGGGAVDCGSGTARSVELDQLPAARLRIRQGRPSPQTAKQLRAIALAKSDPSNSSGNADADTNASGSTNSGDGSIAARPAADSTDQRGDGAGASWPWFGGVALIVLLVAGIVIRRRRPATPGE